MNRENPMTGRFLELYNTIQKLISDNNFMNNKNYKTLPYQTEINLDLIAKILNMWSLLNIYIRDGLFHPLQ